MTLKDRESLLKPLIGFLLLLSQLERLSSYLLGLICNVVDTFEHLLYLIELFKLVLCLLPLLVDLLLDIFLLFIIEDLKPVLFLLAFVYEAH